MGQAFTVSFKLTAWGAHECSSWLPCLPGLGWEAGVHTEALQAEEWDTLNTGARDWNSHIHEAPTLAPPYHPFANLKTPNFKKSTFSLPLHHFWLSNQNIFCCFCQETQRGLKGWKKRSMMKKLKHWDYSAWRREDWGPNHCWFSSMWRVGTESLGTSCSPCALRIEQEETGLG